MGLKAELDEVYKNSLLLGIESVPFGDIYFSKRSDGSYALDKYDTGDETNITIPSIFKEIGEECLRIIPQLRQSHSVEAL